MKSFFYISFIFLFLGITQANSQSNLPSCFSENNFAVVIVNEIIDFSHRNQTEKGFNIRAKGCDGTFVVNRGDMSESQLKELKKLFLLSNTLDKYVKFSFEVTNGAGFIDINKSINLSNNPE